MLYFIKCYFLLHIYFVIHCYAQGSNTLSRLDCYPDPNVTPTLCQSRGCIFDSTTYDSSLNVPPCYFPNNTGYVAEVPVNSSNNITLKKSAESVKNPFDQDFVELNFQSTEIGNGLYISISPTVGTRYVPPVPINRNAQIASSDKLNIIKKNDSIFSFVVQRQSSGKNIWDTSIGGLFFADRFLQIATFLPTKNIYGLGEQIHTSIKHNLSSYITWGMWTFDPEGIVLNKNLYGTHPFYMGLEDDGNAHGVFFFNSNAQEVVLGPAPHLIYRTIGGQFDIFFFPGPTPEQVIQQYQQVIGTPFLPAYWALGFHICRFGYNSTKDLQVVVNRTIENQIPFDVPWVDANYMDNFKDFTIGPGWGDFSPYIDYLHTQGMHVMLMTDCGIEVDYDSFKRGIDQNASFIEWARDDLVQTDANSKYPYTNGTKIMLAEVWPDYNVAFPDFLDPTNQTTQWWINEIKLFRQNLSMDGLWIDMNEPAVYNNTFYNLTTKQYASSLSYSGTYLSCPLSNDDNDTVYDTPPYWTHNVYYNTPGQAALSKYLASGTLCMSAVTARRTQRFFNTKDLYGWSEARATSQVLRDVMGKRGAIIARSTFPSSGHYTGHWLGDNYATWDYLKYSIIGLQEFNMFGIPFVGSDICGFKFNTTQELCLRWQQLGAFYGFMRNHNDMVDADQDPGVWPTVAAAARKANLFRYQHLPYFYSLFFSASLKGGTVVRPVFFEFPNDMATYDLSFQFLWGPALMIIPVINEGATTQSGYLPVDAIWYSVYDYFYGTKVTGGNNSFPAPTNYLIPVFVRGGYIVPRKRPDVTTTASRQHEFQLLIALDKNNKANGELYWDDGDSVVDDISTYNNYHFEFSFSAQAQSSTLNITMTKATNLTLQFLDNIEIFGYPYDPNLRSATLNGNPIAINTGTSSYSPFTQVLNITTTNFLDLNTGGPWILTWNNQ